MSDEKSAPDAATVDPGEAAARSIDEPGQVVPRQTTAEADPLPTRTPATPEVAEEPASTNPAAETAEPPRKERMPLETDSGQPMVAVAAAPPAKRRGRGLLVTFLIAILVLIILAVVGYLVVGGLYADPTRDAKTGDCLTSLPQVDPGQDEEAPGAKVVACSDPAATHRVEGRLDGQSAEQARNGEICRPYPEANFIYRAVPETGAGYVLCLKKLSP